MWRILIVDDEPYIVDGLSDLFMEMPELELEVYKAYSGIQALDWLNRTKIDIVLSDVRMPQMSGLELQQSIREMWPYCKVIFLTGYGEFDYIQTALRGGSVDYVLKTEYDDAVVEAVKKAIASLESDMRSDLYMRQARERLQMALPALQKEYLLAFLEGDLAGCELKSERLRELGIDLALDEAYYMIAGRVDSFGGMTYTDRALLLFAVQNIAEEHFRATAPLRQQLLADHGSFLWFVRCDRPPQFVLGLLESVQNTCRTLLKLPVSFAASGRAVGWGEMPAVYERLRNMLRRGLGHGREMLLTDTAAANPADAPDEGKRREARKPLKKLALLEACLESGQQAEFNEHYANLTELCRANPSAFVGMEIYYKMVSMLLSYANRWGLESSFDLIPPRDWSGADVQDALLGLRDAANALFSLKKQDLDTRTEDIVEQIDGYIASHLDGDLSLTRLAEFVYLNPSYLSRLYKSTAGVGLSETINEAKLKRCKELLQQPHMKIHEVGKAVGFESPPYFTRFIKKMTNMTPQEFRDSLNK